MVSLTKFFLRALLRLLYKVDMSGMEHFHQAGDRALIIANHTSLLDGLLLYAWLPETPVFAINAQVARLWRYRPFLVFVDLFTMEPTSPLSVKSMVKFLRQDKKAVIFPEGRITTTGAQMKVYDGTGLIADRSGATLLPIAIGGAQHSNFGYLRDTKMKLLRFPRITLRVMPPEQMNLDPALQGRARRKAAVATLEAIMRRLSLACYDFDTTVFEEVLRTSQLFGKHRVALEDITRRPLRYGRLVTNVLVLGRFLRRSTQPGAHVGLLLPNVTATAVSVLALQYCGRVPAMLNYSSGAKALLHACAVASIKTVYTSRRFLKQAALEPLAEDLGAQVKLVYLEDLPACIGISDKLLGLLRSLYPLAHYRRVARHISTEDPAVLLFTSGSEGAPKGVALSHRNLTSNFAQASARIGFRSDDIFFSCLPLFHSFGLNVCCLLPLTRGSRIFLYPTPLHYRLIPEMVYATNATILCGANTFLKGYARHAHPYDFNSLRLALAGAEKLHEDTSKAWMEKFGIRILQGYGCTECSPVVAVNTPVEHKAQSVGRLAPGIQAYLEPVNGIETGGRLVVKGPNIMSGYLAQDASGIIQAPATTRGAGWYDTGDIATIDAEGFVTIIGRAKRFAKIGGEMVSLSTVEELAGVTWPDFNHAAVTLPDERKGEKIILVTDCAGAHRKSIQETGRQLKYGELYVPKDIVCLEALPVIGTGKTDYVALTRMLQDEQTA